MDGDGCVPVKLELWTSECEFYIVFTIYGTFIVPQNILLLIFFTATI